MLYVSLSVIFYILLLIFLKISKKFQIVDIPNSRKVHERPIPTIGGLVILLTIFIHLPFIQLPDKFLLILFASLIILIIGVLDDLYQIGIISRIISQIISCLIVIGSGLSIVDIGDYSMFQEFELGMFGILLTVFSVLCLINAINFIDGIDGLSASMVTISFISLIIFSLLENNLYVDEFILVFILVLLFFIFFNLGFINKYKIFLGDAGSTTIGFILSWVLIYNTFPEHRIIHPVLAIWCITIPIYDFLAVIIRRMKLKINPFKPDNKHIHHLIISKNISHTNCLIILIILSFFSNMLGGAIFYFFGPGPCLLAYIVYFIIFFTISENFLKLKN